MLVVVLACGAAGGGSDGDPEYGAGETGDVCDRRASYQLVAMLTSGGTECSEGGEYTTMVGVQNRSEDECPRVTCLESLNCVSVTCEPGDTECVGTSQNGQCVYGWVLSRRVR